MTTDVEVPPPTMPYGKHKRKSISQIASEDSKYFLWLTKHVEQMFPVSSECPFSEANKRIREEIDKFSKDIPPEARLHLGGKHKPKKPAIPPPCRVEDVDNLPITFGKYKNTKYKDLPDKYILWLLRGENIRKFFNVDDNNIFREKNMLIRHWLNEKSYELEDYKISPRSSKLTPGKQIIYAHKA